MFYSFVILFLGGGSKSGNKYILKSLVELSLLLFIYLFIVFQFITMVITNVHFIRMNNLKEGAGGGGV